MGSRRGENKFVSVHESAVTAIGANIELDGIDMMRPHCFAGVQFFSDAAGTTPAVPTVGSVVIKVKTLNTQLFEQLVDGTITAAAPASVSWAANTTAVKAEPTGVDVATHYKLVVTCNEA